MTEVKMESSVRYKNIRLIVFFSALGFLWFGIRILAGGRIVLMPFEKAAVYLVIAPVCEELFFRSFIQNWLSAKTGTGVNLGFFRLSYANILASVLFGFAHGFAWPLMHAFLVMVPSLIFGYMYERTGRIYSAIFLHCLYNLNGFIL